MGAAERLLDTTFKGRRSGREWTVTERADEKDGHSNGHFSVGYRVRSDEGQEAFLKASDLSLLTNEGDDIDPFERLDAAVRAHSFERRILDHCQGSNMDRVVVALDYGSLEVDVDGVRDRAFMIVFELARCDARQQADRLRAFDLVWSLSALHDLAVAIQQLHRGQVSHNDIKPANLLVFDEKLQKLADLGCATSPHYESLHDENHCVGDRAFAAPECLYVDSEAAAAALCGFDARRASDIYHLGSMGYFLVTGRMLTPEIVRRLAPEHRPYEDGTGWTGSFVDVMPYWREAFGRAVESLGAALPRAPGGALTAVATELVGVVQQLGEPDPSLRGHPNNRAGRHDRLGVDRYVSLFDRLRKNLMVRG